MLCLICFYDKETVALKTSFVTLIHCPFLCVCSINYLPFLYSFSVAFVHLIMAVKMCLPPMLEMQFVCLIQPVLLMYHANHSTQAFKLASTTHGKMSH